MFYAALSLAETFVNKSDYIKILADNSKGIVPYITYYNFSLEGILDSNLRNQKLPLHKIKRMKFNDEIKSIVIGLFALIGFIILVYSIFIAAIDEPLASVTDTIFVAAIIGSFILVGIIIGKRLLNE